MSRYAVQGVEAGDTGLAPESPRTFADDLVTIGYEGACKAAVAAGRTPPSERTFRRWKQDNRIPDATTADLVSRRAHIVNLGGVEQAAAAMGRSTSAVYDWQAGRTHELKLDARQRMDQIAALKRLAANNIDPNTRPIIRFTADVHVRMEGERYDYRTRKRFVFGDGQYDREPMPLADVRAFNLALARGDMPSVVAILEEHASTRYAEIGDYGDNVGIHFDTVRDLKVEWP